MLEDRRKKPRTAAEDDAVAEFRRLLAEMLGEPPPDESDDLETQATADPEFGQATAPEFGQAIAPEFSQPTDVEFGQPTDPEYAEPADVTFPADSPEATDVNHGAIDGYEHQEASADLSPAPFQEDTTDDAYENQIITASRIQPAPVTREDLGIDPEQQSVPVTVDRTRVRIELKDGRCLDAWRRSSPAIGPQMLILDVIATFDFDGKEIASNPADSFTFRSEITAINGSKINEVQQSEASSPINPSPNDQRPEKKERS